MLLSHISMSVNSIAIEIGHWHLQPFMKAIPLPHYCEIGYVPTMAWAA